MKEKRQISKEALRQSVVLPLSALETNRGQIEGVPANPRAINAAKFKKLKASIQENPEMLALREVLVYPHGAKYVIIGGNMRFRALKELGYTEAVCKVIPKEATPEQLRAVTIKDNNNFGEWDFDLLANEWDAEELDAWGIDLPQMDAEVSEDEAKEDNFDTEEAAKGEPRCREGDIYKLGQHRLVCADPTDPRTLAVLCGGQKADALIATAPTPDKEESGSDYTQRLAKAMQCASARMKQGAAFYLWHNGSQCTAAHAATKAAGLEAVQTLIWVKNILEMGGNDYQTKHEPCLYGWKQGARRYFIDRRDFTTVWSDPDFNVDALTKQELKDLLVQIMEEQTTVLEEDAPTQCTERVKKKPLKLLGRLMINSTRQGEVILDTFGGNGCTIMAAEQLNRKCYTVESRPKFADIICKRYEALTGDTAVYLGNINGSE